MKRAFARSVVTCLCLAGLPAAAFAQASITGVVKDTSGAVLPGVTVEASSPAIIEKVRTAVTDGSGQYRITELRPGAYVVTFTLAGFNTVKRDGNTWTFEGETERARYDFSRDGRTCVIKWEFKPDGELWKPLCDRTAKRVD